MAHRRLRRWIVVATLAAAAVGFFAYRQLRPTEVSARPVIRGRAVEAIYATGTVEPRELVVVKSRISEHVAELFVREGDTVACGQLLARIENPAREHALTQGEVQLARAERQAGRGSPSLSVLAAQVRALRSQLELAQVELARTEKLARDAAAPGQQLDAARARVAQLDAQVQAAEAQLRSSRTDLAASRDQLASQVKALEVEADEGAIVAPIAGVVLRREVETGEVVAQNQALFAIADTTELLVELHVDEADIARVRDGADGSAVALSFYAFPGQAFAGRVAMILPDPDRVRRSYTVRVRLEAPPAGLRVGMTSEANVILERREGVLLLPAEAVDGDHAWFAVGGRAVRRPVTLGVRDLVTVEVTAGAAEGDLAIVDAAARGLHDGERIHATVGSAR